MTLSFCVLSHGFVSLGTILDPSECTSMHILDISLGNYITYIGQVKILYFIVQYDALPERKHLEGHSRIELRRR